MSHHADPTTFACRCAHSETSERTIQITPPAIASVPVSSQSQFRFHPWDISSESGSISSTGSESSPVIPSHTPTGYNYAHRSDDQPLWGYPITRYDARPLPLEYPPDLSFAPSPCIGDPRARLDQLFPRIRACEVVYTDDARMKLSEGVIRWCFNCRATGTTTWRRSSLSPGKLLCNRCGLFERTHRRPRPETFPRRRRARPAPGGVLSTPGFSPPFGGAGEQWQCPNDHLFSSPLTPFLQPFDAVGGQSSISQSASSWMTQNEAGPSSSPATGGQCYPGTSQLEQQTTYRGYSQ